MGERAPYRPKDLDKMASGRNTIAKASAAIASEATTATAPCKRPLRQGADEPQRADRLCGAVTAADNAFAAAQMPKAARGIAAIALREATRSESEYQKPESSCLITPSYAASVM